MKFIKKVLFLALSYLLFSIIFKYQFVDEQENLVAGWLMLKGLVPYKDFFFHHAPLPFFISQFLNLLPISGFIQFRFFIFIYIIGIYYFLLKSTKSILHWTLLLTLFLEIFLLSHLNLQMFLADSLIAHAFLALVILFIAQINNNSKLDFKQFFNISLILSFIIAWSSIIYLPALLIFYLVVFYIFRNFLWQNKVKVLKKLVIFLLINLIFPFYFLINQSFKQFIWSVFTYNQKFYLPFRLASNEQEKKLGVIFRIFNQFFLIIKKDLTAVFQASILFLQASKGILFQFFKNNLAKTINLVWIIIDQLINSIFLEDRWLTIIFLIITVIVVRKIKWKAIPLILFLILLRARTNEIFHHAPFYLAVIAIFNYYLLNFIKKRAKLAYLFGFIYILILLNMSKYYFFALNTQSGLISAQQKLLAAQIKGHTTAKDKILIIGENPIYYALANRLPASSIIYYHPWFHYSIKLKTELLTAVKQQLASLIVLNRPFQDYLFEDRDFVISFNSKYYSISDRLYLKQVD